MQGIELQTSHKWYLHFYGFLLSSTGWFFGYGIAMFNTFFDQFIEVVYGVYDDDKKVEISGNLSLFFLIGGLLCCVSCAKVYENLGRYRTIVLFQLLNIICIVLELIHGLYLLYVLRIIHGYLACSYTFISIVMMTENLPNSISKIWNSAFYIFLTGGILTSYLFSTKQDASNWRLVFAFPIVFDLPRLILLLFVYRMESPIWLYTKYIKEGNVDEIEYLMEENYSHSYSKENAKRKALMIIDQQQKLQELETKDQDKDENLLSPLYRKQFLLILYLNFLNQMTGINFLVFYSTNIYKQLDLNSAEKLTFYMGIINFSSGFAIQVFQKLMDLRDILIYGLLMQSIGFFIFLIGFTFSNGILAVIGSYLYMFAFGCSMGGSLYPYQTLVLPSKGVSIASISQWLMACVVGKYALIVIEKLGIFYTFYFFMFMALIGSIVTSGYAVRVNGKTKYQIEKEFMTKKFLIQ